MFAFRASITVSSYALVGCIMFVLMLTSLSRLANIYLEEEGKEDCDTYTHKEPSGPVHTKSVL